MSFNKEFSREFVEKSLWFIGKTVLAKGRKNPTYRSGGLIAKAEVGGIKAMISFEDKSHQAGDLMVLHPTLGFEAIGIIDRVTDEGPVFSETKFKGNKKAFRDWVLMYKLGYDDDGPLSHPSDEAN